MNWGPAVRWLGALALVAFCLGAVSALRVSAQPEAIARVTGTGSDGLVLRAEASRSAARITVEPEGTIVTVIGPEQFSEGRSWLPVRDAQGRVGWLALEYLTVDQPPTPTPRPTVVTVADVAPEPTATPIPRRVAREPAQEPEPEPDVGLPVSVEIRFKFPELYRRDRQMMTVNVTRNSQPVQDVTVRFIVEDEDPEVEREASPTDSDGRSVHEWSMRKYRGTTTVRVTAIAPDGGAGKAARSFFVK